VADPKRSFIQASFALKAITGVEFVESFRLYLTLNNLLFSGLTYKHLARDAHANGYPSFYNFCYSLLFVFINT
jgi:hypothetical protein